jgi:hypothetical protein
MNKNYTILNKENAIEVSKAVISAYENKEKLFSHAIIKEIMFPEKQLVSVLPKEKQALWLFFSCLGDKMVSSEIYYKQFREFYLSNPDFFDSKNLKNRNSFVKGLGGEFTKKVQVAIPDDFIHFAASNAKKLANDFNGNPVNALRGNDFKTSVKNLKQFSGYGTGLASLYLIFLNRYDIRKTEGLAPKIDRHFLRISAGCGIAQIEEGSRADSLAEKLSKLYEEVCNENKIDAAYLDAAMWVIGKEVCSKKDAAYCKLLCPIDDYCNKELPKINREDARMYRGKNHKSNLNQLLFDFK